MAVQEHVVRVSLDPPYPVFVRPGLVADLGPRLRAISAGTRAAVVTDSNVGPRYLAGVLASLEQEGFASVAATLPAGESHKHLADLLPIYDQFLGHRIDRQTIVIGLGGGVVTDVTGFVAATVLRGVPLVQVPTTLLAMVDASVGGKTGVNHAAGKNLIGAFHQPTAVFADPDVLKTLPATEFRGGLAECIKHECIRDAEGFARLENNVDRVLSLDPAAVAELVAHNVGIKAAVVAADPFERGERAHLNFGHTFAHAFEKVSRYAVPHGEAVALGMVAAARVSHAVGLLDDASRVRITRLVARAGLPTGGLTLDTASVVEAMAFDKKVHLGKLRFVLLDRIGHALIRDDVPPDVVRAAVDQLHD